MYREWNALLTLYFAIYYAVILLHALYMKHGDRMTNLYIQFELPYI